MKRHTPWQQQVINRAITEVFRFLYPLSGCRNCQKNKASFDRQIATIRRDCGLEVIEARMEADEAHRQLRELKTAGAIITNEAVRKAVEGFQGILAAKK